MTTPGLSGDLVLAQNQYVLSGDLDLGAGVLPEQDLVAAPDVQGEGGAWE
jgi:hypothetical protein